MTYKEMLKKEYPEIYDKYDLGTGCFCPSDFGYIDEKTEDKYCRILECVTDEDERKVCTECWNREMQETKGIRSEDFEKHIMQRFMKRA